MKIRRHHFRFWFFLLPIIVFSITNIAFAASTGTTNLLMQSGSGYATQGGDYVSSSGGLNTYYRYFIEVPPNTTNLTVEIYDADIGARTNYTDWMVNTSYNSSCNYSLRNPNGSSVASQTFNNTQTTADSAWTRLYTVANPAAGHWELRVDMSSTVTTGDDYNGYGIRVHDGTSGAGGTELNVYAHSFLPVGVVGANGTTKTTTFYPYITSGCIVDWNNFDGDFVAGGANECQYSYASRVDTISAATYNGSANNVWGNRAITSYNTDLQNIDTGLWTGTGRYMTLSGSTANFGVFWAGNWQAANGAPSAQPQADSFRVYLPTDGNARPVKPFITQKLSFISGSNPPSNGSTSRVRVEIAVFNPAAQAITFSAANVISANIPGGGVVYGGNPIVSQGSLISQPAIGGTGNITWNPGSVAAGTTPTLYYYVDVTPTSAGQRLPVTGIPGTNGTTATFVDTTGNTTQAQATFTYGPLCGLAVTEDGDPIPTWVAVTCFDACAEESQPTVEWHTATEAGAVGFNLWRQDPESKEFLLVNPNFLPALPSSPQGGVYRLADPGARYGEPVVYRLEEIDSLGRTLSYGPFTITFGAALTSEATGDPAVRKGKEEPSDIYGYQRFGRERSEFELARLQARGLEMRRGSLLAASQGRERARITVKGSGLFYVSAAQIANSLGVPLANVAALINGRNLNLSGMSKNIAWLADRNGAGIFFFNEGKETPYADKNVFWLERGSGLTMETIGAGSAGPASPGQTYRESLHFEENRYALTALFNSAKDDIWLWDYIVAGDSAKSFPVMAPGVAASGTATLTVTLQGETDTRADNDHHALISLNGSDIGAAYWDGAKDHTFQVSFSQSLLREGANTLAVRGALDMGAPYSIFYVESFDLAYQREYKAVGNVLLCNSDANSVITVAGFFELDVLALDVSNPARPKQVVGVAPDVSGRVTFVSRNTGTPYLVSGLNAAQRPLAVVGDKPAQLKGQGNAAEYLVIAPAEFRDAAQELADYRQGQGLKALVVTLEDIYESFSYGMPSPLAIRDFLAYAYTKWGGKKVKYAVLAGKGTYDYKDHLGLGDNLVPVILARTSEGLFAADKEFGDVSGKNGLPEIAIGRLPAVTAAELRVLIAKIKAYESGQGDWAGKALWIADNADDGGDFAQGCDELQRVATGFSAEEFYLTGSLQETRDRIIAAWNAGAGLVNYCGHGGLAQLAAENLFSVTTANALSNGGRLPLAVMLTCVVGRFELPGFTSLAEALVLNGNGGIAGGLFPAAAALHADSMRLGEEFFKSALRGQGTTVGQALVAAMKNYLQQGGKSSLLNVYNWIGDPALKFK